jgi:hypothetical protein
MAPRFSFLAAILLSLPAALLIAGTAISSRPEEVSLPPAPESPLAVIAALEKAWRAGDSEAVLACVSADAVELALDREGPPGGRFARAQAEFLIRDLLHYGETVEFKVTAFEWKAGKPRLCPRRGRRGSTGWRAVRRNARWTSCWRPRPGAGGWSGSPLARAFAEDLPSWLSSH